MDPKYLAVWDLGFSYEGSQLCLLVVYMRVGYLDPWGHGGSDVGRCLRWYNHLPVAIIMLCSPARNLSITPTLKPSVHKSEGTSLASMRGSNKGSLLVLATGVHGAS